MIDCVRRWVRRVPAHSADGPRILYTRAQVIARRKAQMVLVVGCTAIGGGGVIVGIQHLPPPWIGLPAPAAIVQPGPELPPLVWLHRPPAPTWRDTGLPVHQVPEPASAALLGGAVTMLLLALRRKYRERHEAGR